jgi:topoisomerase IA-like protein
MTLRKKFKKWFGFPSNILDVDAFVENIDKEEDMVLKKAPAKKAPAKKAPVKKAPDKKTTAKKTTAKKTVAKKTAPKKK